MKPRNAVVALLAGLLLLAGCSTPPAPAPTPTPTESVIVVDPGAVATVPLPEVTPLAKPDDPNNGRVPEIPQAVLDQQVVVSGLGGPVDYAANGHNAARFTPQQAAAVAEAEAARPSGINWTGLCEGFAGSYAYGWSSSGWASARDGYYGTPHRRQMLTTSDSRVGAVLRWPNSPYGHAVIYVGGSRVATTDFVTQGRVSIVSLRQISDAWFGGQLPSTFDPVEFPVGYGNNGLKAPLIPAPAPVTVHKWPMLPGHTYPGRTPALKRALHWSPQSAAYGSRWAKRLIVWQRNHPAYGAANGHVRPRMWVRITGQPA